MCVLGIEPWSYKRTASAFNLWASSTKTSSTNPNASVQFGALAAIVWVYNGLARLETWFELLRNNPRPECSECWHQASHWETPRPRSYVLPTVLESFLGAVLIQDPTHTQLWAHCSQQVTLCVGITRAEFLGVTAGYLTKTQHIVSQFGCKMYPTDTWTRVTAVVGSTGLPRQEAYHCRVGLWGLMAWPYFQSTRAWVFLTDFSTNNCLIPTHSPQTRTV